MPEKLGLIPWLEAEPLLATAIIQCLPKLGVRNPRWRRYRAAMTSASTMAGLSLPGLEMAIENKQTWRGLFENCTTRSQRNCVSVWRKYPASSVRDTSKRRKPEINPLPRLSYRSAESREIMRHANDLLLSRHLKTDPLTRYHCQNDPLPTVSSRNCPKDRCLLIIQEMNLPTRKMNRKVSIAALFGFLWRNFKVNSTAR